METRFGLVPSSLSKVKKKKKKNRNSEKGEKKKKENIILRTKELILSASERHVS